LHLTSKTLRLDYAGLKKRLRSAPQTLPPSPAFLELVTATPAECVVELESAGSRRRVALKGIPLDWNKPAERLARSRAMIQITPQMRVLVAVDAVDGRKGIDSLAQLCREKLAADPFSGCVFLFRSRSATTLKILVYDLC
jgi:hypothetical protein